MYLGSHLTPRNLKPVVNAIVGAVEELRQHVPREGDPRDDLLVHTTGSVAPVEHPLAAADELLERVLAQLANVGVEGPQERLRHGHPVLPGDPGRLPEYKVARWQNLIPSFPWIAPVWRAKGMQSKERKGSNFAA